MVIYKLPECTPVSSIPEGAVYALGNFDGVHRGHQRLFDEARELADKRGSFAAVWTFNALAKPDLATPFITDMSTKLSLFCEYGLDYAVFEDFEDIKHMRSDEFFSCCIIEKLKAGGVICGFNFRFGKDGAGDSQLLCALAEAAGIACAVVDAVTHEDVVISSTVIRKMILEGDMEGAQALMGHPFSINFPVVHGNQIGRTIGIPTINQSFPEGHIIPANGIYACSCYVNGEIYLSVANVGVRPTVSDSGTVNCETHIINYSGDLYDKEIKVEFYDCLRCEMKFDSVEALRRQIKIDICACLDYFCTMYG